MRKPTGPCAVCQTEQVIRWGLFGVEAVDLCLKCSLSLLQHLIEDSPTAKVKDAVFLWRLWYGLLPQQKREEFEGKDWPAELPPGVILPEPEDECEEEEVEEEIEEEVKDD